MIVLHCKTIVFIAASIIQYLRKFALEEGEQMYWHGVRHLGSDEYLKFSILYLQNLWVYDI